MLFYYWLTVSINFFSRHFCVVSGRVIIVKLYREIIIVFRQQNFLRGTFLCISIKLLKLQFSRGTLSRHCFSRYFFKALFFFSRYFFKGLFFFFRGTFKALFFRGTFSKHYFFDFCLIFSRDFCIVLSIVGSFSRHCFFFSRYFFEALLL